MHDTSVSSSICAATQHEGLLCWLHFGDLHIVDAEADNFRDLQRLIAEANRHLAGAVDFSVLPGDNAENGAPDQYALVRAAFEQLNMPVHVIPGDHDMEPGHLGAFYEGLAAESLPKAFTLAGRRCVFLDMVSNGRGGPDFRLGRPQLNWLAGELARADGGGGSVVFMHTYPADLADGNERRAVIELFARHRVVAVDVGHTHYNELANDGRVIYAATRSTGQIEEGEPGFSIGAVDAGEVVSWRFKALGGDWPMVMVTSPSDRRLATRQDQPSHLLRAGERFPIRALAFPADRVVACRYRLDNCDWKTMAKHGKRLWTASDHAPPKSFALTVEAIAASGKSGCETIELGLAGYFQPPVRQANGSDADALGGWPEKGILGTQLGPNRNGRKW
jgi:3',5'-cyclic-AMP phosphodiesterase